MWLEDSDMKAELKEEFTWGPSHRGRVDMTSSRQTHSRLSVVGAGRTRASFEPAAVSQSHRRVGLVRLGVFPY